MSDPTFTSYTADQAAAYAIGRASSYPTPLYHQLLSSIVLPTDSRTVLVDVGCGTGQVTKDLAHLFDDAIGVDPSAAMIGEAGKQAQELGSKTKNGGELRFEVAGAEEFDQADGIKEGTVDVVVSGMAAHWFDMGRFWAACARVLKPGGTVALWTCASMYCHPSTSNAAEVQRILFKLERTTLAPYELPGNRLSRDMYANLPLPWTLSPTHALPFSPASFSRIEWDKDGVPSAADGEFLGGSDEQTLERIEKGLNTASMVTRWREANAGKEEDCVAVLIRELREALGGKETLDTGAGTVLLLVKKDI